MGRQKKNGWGKFLKLEHGMYRRVFCALKPMLIENCFMEWVRAIKRNVDREVIAIDGKTVRGSNKSENRSEDGTSGERVGDGGQIGVRTGKNGGKKQRDNGDTDIVGDDNAGRLSSYHRRDGMSRAICHPSSRALFCRGALSGAMRSIENFDTQFSCNADQMMIAMLSARLVSDRGKAFSVSSPRADAHELLPSF
jgi:hypothetical protein